MFPEMNNFSRGDYIFLQDGARSHTAKTTPAFFNENCQVYVKRDHQPPNCPNLNLLDLATWCDFEKKVWKNRPHDVEVLSRQSLKNGEIIRKK